MSVDEELQPSRCGQYQEGQKKLLLLQGVALVLMWVWQSDLVSLLQWLLLLVTQYELGL
jgi:hypothetical protein